MTELIRRTKPDLLVLTGDSVFPFFPKSGTMNNRKQAQKLLEFLDSFQIPYTLVFGNHDCEMGSTCNKEQLSDILPRANTRSLPKADMNEARLLFPAWGILCWIW